MMIPAVNKEETTYIQMHSAISQANTIRDSLTATTARPPSMNGGSTNTFTNSPVIGQYLLMLYCLHCHLVCYFTRAQIIVCHHRSFSDPFPYMAE